jgi:hypothetical protein
VLAPVKGARRVGGRAVVLADAALVAMDQDGATC